MKFILKFFHFLEPKWLDDLKKIEQFHKILSSGFAKKQAWSDRTWAWGGEFGEFSTPSCGPKKV